MDGNRKVRVVWNTNGVQNGSPSTFTGFLVRSSSMHLAENFDTISQLPPGWEWDNRRRSATKFTIGRSANGDGYLDLSMDGQANCWLSTQNCPRLLIPHPHGIIDHNILDTQNRHRGNSWTAEVRVRMTTLQPGNAAAGLGIVQDSGSDGNRNGRVRFMFMLRRNAGETRLRCHVQENQGTKGTDRMLYGTGPLQRDVWLRMKYDVIGNRFTFFCRMNHETTWQTVIPNGLFPPSHGGDLTYGRVILTGKNWSNRQQVFRFDSFSLTVDDCPSSAITRFIPAADARIGTTTRY